MQMKQLYRKIHSHFKLNGLLFSHDELKEVAYSLIKEGEPFEKEIGDFLMDWLDDNMTLEVHTSGSTGKPKRITLQKQHMVNSALATGGFFGLQPGDSALLCLPANYIAGKMMLVRAMVLGLELDYVSPSSNPLNGISSTYEFCAMVPFQLENSLDGLRQIKFLMVGGAPISYKVQMQVQKAHSKALSRTKTHHSKTLNFSTSVFETYGMTETITHIALKNIAQNNLRNPVFKTLPNVKVSTDERGCLVIDAPKIIDTPVVTNDMVDLVSETEFQWLGRYDNVINSGGVKLFPEQIEAKMASVIHSRFFVAGIPDEKLGQKLIVVVEGMIDEVQLLEEIKSLETLVKFEVPKEIYRVVAFRETDNGKIQRDKTLVLALG